MVGRGTVPQVARGALLSGKRKQDGGDPLFEVSSTPWKRNTTSAVGRD